MDPAFALMIALGAMRLCGLDKTEFIEDGHLKQYCLAVCFRVKAPQNLTPCPSWYVPISTVATKNYDFIDLTSELNVLEPGNRFFRWFYAGHKSPLIFREFKWAAFKNQTSLPYFLSITVPNKLVYCSYPSHFELFCINSNVGRFWGLARYREQQFFKTVRIKKLENMKHF